MMVGKRCTNKCVYVKYQTRGFIYILNGPKWPPVSCFLIHGHAWFLVLTDPDLSSHYKPFLYIPRHTGHSDNIDGNKEKTSATNFLERWATQHRAIISPAMSHKPPMLSNSYAPDARVTRDKVRNFFKFSVAEGWWGCYLDELWHNSNASFTNASSFAQFVVSFKLNFKFIKLTPGTNHPTPHQSFTNSLPWSWPCTPTSKRQLKNLWMFRRSPERSRLQRNPHIYSRNGTH